jgi:hypothetical protein
MIARQPVIRKVPNPARKGNMWSSGQGTDLLIARGFFADLQKSAEDHKMKKTVFIYFGEGTNNSETNFKLLKHSKYWSAHPIDFIRSMETIKEKYTDDHLDIIEIGFHLVLSKCCEIFGDYTYGSSIYRGEDEIK